MLIKNNSPAEYFSKTLQKSKFSLPSIKKKSSSSRTFLSVDDNRNSIFSNDLKIVPEKPKKHKIHITMNEELSSYIKETTFKIAGNEETSESIDVRKTLLYDKHLINRQKAAANICKCIIEEVKNKFEAKTPSEESPLKRTTKFDRYLKEIISKANEVQCFDEKFEVINERSQETYLKALREEFAGFELKVQSEETPVELVAHRSSKSKEKSNREEIVQINTDLRDFLSDDQEFFEDNKDQVLGILQQFSRFVPIEKTNVFFSVLSQRIELGSPSFQKNLKGKKVLICFNHDTVSLPNVRLDCLLMQFIVFHMKNWGNLVKVDISCNSIGDKHVALLISFLRNFSKKLEYLDVSFTQSGTSTAQSLQGLLKENSSLEQLKIEGNALKDEGICLVVLGLLANSSVRLLNISDNQIENLGGIAISKLVRINKVIKGLNCSKSEISGVCFREICRSLIVNSEIKSFSANFCKLNDSDAKEIGHMLNRNVKLQQLCVTHNRISNAGLEWVKYGLSRNRALIHLALSGNEGIRLRGLERLKMELGGMIEIDIGKEDDYFRSQEGVKNKLIELLK